MIDSALQVPRRSTITRQVHRGERGVVSWWNTTTVCDLPGSFGPGDLLELVGLIPAIRRMGFDGILLRLSVQDIAPQTRYIVRLVKAVHAADMRVIVRVSPDLVTVPPLDSPPLVELHDDPVTLVERTRFLLEAGVDGVDLGMIDDDPDSPNPDERATQFTKTVNQQLAELASVDSTAILTAEASTANQQFFNHHLQEDWFHHLRDDSLFQSPWNAQELCRRIGATYASRTPLGQTVAWRPALTPKRENATYQRVVEPGSWSDHASPQRVNAFTTFVSSLPGALYLPFIYAGGEIGTTGGDNPGVRLSLSQEPSSRYQHDLTTRMLTLRQQKGLSHANLAFVEGLEWAGPNVAVHLSGHTLVVLNASDENVIVPAEHLPLLYSDGFLLTENGNTVLQPDTCAWFDTAPAKTHDPGKPTWA